MEEANKENNCYVDISQ